MYLDAHRVPNVMIISTNTVSWIAHLMTSVVMVMFLLQLEVTYLLITDTFIKCGGLFNYKKV